jgi:hypothetical protein
MILHGIDASNIIHTNILSDNLADVQEKDRYGLSTSGERMNKSLKEAGV